jgi:hypothetical protein
MGNIIEFDSSKLNGLIDDLGIRNAWLSILATHISSRAELTYILENQTFSQAQLLAEDVIEGLSIGEIGVLYEYSVSRVDSNARKENGQYFTPDDVAMFMAGFAADFPDGVWLDPCCGVGNLTWHLVAQQKSPETFLLNSMVLSDRDELALFVARVLLTAAFQDEISHLFNLLEPKFISFDFLSVADDGVASVYATTSELAKIPKHDFVIVNPPYLAIKQDSRFEVAQAGDLYAYFLENIIKTSLGFISVTPQSFTNASKFRSLRKLLLSKFSDLTIFTFDNVPANVFRGIKFGSRNSNKANSIRAAITIARPGLGKHRISSLLRWRNSERDVLFRLAPTLLSTTPFTEDYFPKIGKSYEELFEFALQADKLTDFCTRDNTNFQLHIPSSPRYFISALKRPVKRASMHTLNFKTAEMRDKAYLVLNSSLTYWWWRTRDGGMTLSLETLLTTPVPKSIEVNPHLSNQLEISESTNRVYKLNAGQAQENVKHSEKLIYELTEYLVPRFSELLTRTHENSSLTQATPKPKFDSNF